MLVIENRNRKLRFVVVDALFKIVSIVLVIAFISAVSIVVLDSAGVIDVIGIGRAIRDADPSAPILVPNSVF